MSSTPPLPLGADGCYHPAELTDVQALTTYATSTGRQLRVLGSGHSVPAAIGTPAPTGLNVRLDRMTAVTMSSGGITAQAGCHLGPDPRDPASTVANSLLGQMTAAGLGLADTGGITHQTVGGFLSTGSSGGSLTHALESQIAAITLVDATGQVHHLTSDAPSPPRADNPFYAAGVSLGLLGVVTDVTFTRANAFQIIGQESVTTEADCAVDLFGPGAGDKPSLAGFLRSTDYTRLTWWPQREVGRVALWRAEPLSGPFPKGAPQPYQELGSYFDVAGLAEALIEGWHMWTRLLSSLERHWPELEKRYRADATRLGATGVDLARQLTEILQAETDEDRLKVLGMFLLNQDLQQVLVGLYFTLLGHRSAGGLCERIFTETFENEGVFEQKWSPIIMNKLFLTLDKDKLGAQRGQPQRFWDHAWTGLPMDNQISDDLMPTVFTELWIPIDRAQQVMTTLREFYAGGGYTRTGTYACEIYGAKASDFWLSPSYGTDVVRVDLYYFGRSATPPDQTFYPQFWADEVLGQYAYRPHWGKYLPAGEDPDFGAAYLASAYPRFDDFMQLRQEWDPDQVFVTDYWRSHLGIRR
ncbi:D-arabinono-1,4-lactone oxidase [Nocardioides insulae]|uniref:D-arabinono-1,4-lactone oxidase n=1 Tax=Nocardioides insulae TaxID=394734 RepID=UPI000413A992|nr:D-arabinono-1,4-lactone oxidase [Nocardioides insulae]